ncbi:Angiopoietin-4 [Fukomys damarensis]|uniref:Angiopoietin-4 n=1 Tax=Fukomys damarensis TaxID=885580 RepID=A0A091CR12_FUKDA|nr:Angiopoietin-4 [Fukomys damarensis]
MEKLQNALRNSTQRLQKGKRDNTETGIWYKFGECWRSYIQTLLRPELQQAQQNTVQKHMVPMLELGTSLLNRTTAQTLKLTNMKAQVLNQMLYMENQMLENMLMTDKLEKHLQEQSHTLYQLHGHNSDLETRLCILEAERQAQLRGLRKQKEQLQQLLSHQGSTLASIQGSVQAASRNCSQLQQKQLQLLENLNPLMRLVKHSPGAAEQVFQDCEEIRRSGVNEDGVYTSHIPNLNQTRRVFCVMDTDGGTWTVIQRRENGKVNFERKWEDYKQVTRLPWGEVLQL